MRRDGSVHRSAQRLSAGGRETRDEIVAEEVAVALVYNGISHAVVTLIPATPTSKSVTGSRSWVRMRQRMGVTDLWAVEWNADARPRHE